MVFSRLKKKYTRLLFCSVATVLITYSITLLFLYVKLLSRDYNDKISYFRMQQTVNLSNRLKLAEFRSGTFLTSFSFPSADSMAQYSTNLQLGRIQNASLYKYTLFLLRQDTDTRYALSSRGFELAQLLEKQRPDIIRSSLNRIQWMFVKSENPSKEMVLCIQSAYVEGSSLPVTLGIAISTMDFLSDYSEKSKSLDVFSGENFAFSIYPEQESLILYEEESPSCLTSESLDLLQKNREITSRQIGTYPFFLDIRTSEKPLYKMLFYFFIGMLILLSFLLLLARIILRLFVNRIAKALTEISSQMKHFSEEELPTEYREDLS